jgi:hypothetical protein
MDSDLEKRRKVNIEDSNSRADDPRGGGRYLSSVSQSEVHHNLMGLHAKVNETVDCYSNSLAGSSFVLVSAKMRIPTPKYNSPS